MKTKAALPAAPGTELLPGYSVVGLMRHGRRMDTYDVYSTERDCRCIVKILRQDRMDEERVRDAVLLEGRLLRDLAHPNLVRAYEVFEHPVPAIVLETLTGATLAALVEEAPLHTADAAHMGLQLVSVLGYLHRQGWLHLDVKPANIIVGSGRATLIDLSLTGRPGSGRPGAGTRGYLSPEQARGEDLSAATDVWGLGVTLIETLTGDLPYGDEATWNTARWQLPWRRAPGFPNGLDRLPTDWRSMVTACIERDPMARPSLDEVRRALTVMLDTAG